MPLIIISIQDTPDGNVDVRLNHEPPVPPEQESFTQAQQLGAIALNAIHRTIRSEGPKIQLVDADGMPH